MALLADYTAGTISVSADDTVVTGVGTAWQVAGFKEGDWFIANGWVNVVASVDSNTSLTLAQPWRGGELTDAPYRLRYMSDGSRVSAQARQLIDMLGGSGSLEALAALTGSANTIPYFTGAGTMGLLTRADLVQGVRFDVQVDELADRDDYDGEDEGFAVLVSDVGDGRSAVYSRVGESGNWTDPAYVTGPVGPANTLAKGTVTTGDPGSEANFSITGDAPNQTLNLTLPRGATGPANSLSKGTVTTGAPGSEADFSITGTAPSQTLSLTIPRGDKGEGLHTDVQVDELSDRDAYDDEDEGFSVLVSDVGDGRAAIYSKNSNASADWSDPAYVTGPSGASDAEDVAYDNAESGLDATDVQAAIDELAAGAVRELLDAPRTYYVRDDGNDGNDGLADTTGGAFATIQKAIDTVAALDLSVHDVTISVGPGTYGPFAMKSCVGAGQVVIVGDEGTPANVGIASAADLDVLAGALNVTTLYHLRGLSFTSAHTSVIGILVQGISYVYFRNCDFGAFSGGGARTHIDAQLGGTVEAAGNWSVSGGATFHLRALSGGTLRVNSRTVTLAGTPAFIDFVRVSRRSEAITQGMTFTGAATGRRFWVDLNGVINGVSSLTYFPGDAQGVQASGGRYGNLGVVFDHGVRSSGTLMPTPDNGDVQRVVNGGAHTLAPPTVPCEIVLRYTNNSSAGAINAAGFGRVAGSFTTTNGHQFECLISFDGTQSILRIIPLQ